MHTFWHLFVAHLQAFENSWIATIHNNLIYFAFLILGVLWASLTLKFRHIDDTRETK
jgi:hypothetical protein